MFIFKKTLNPNGGRIMMEFTLSSSGTYTVGDAMKIDSSGELDLVGAGASVAGILAGFRTAAGEPLTDNGASGEFTNTYTTPASNTVLGKIDISKESIYSVTADATLGTTTGSDLAGYMMDVLAASDQLDESTAAQTASQFMSLGQDTDSLAADNSVLVKIYESFIYGPLAG